MRGRREKGQGQANYVFIVLYRAGEVFSEAPGSREQALPVPYQFALAYCNILVFLVEYKLIEINPISFSIRIWANLLNIFK
jgi:hypothetical protein